MSIRPARNSIFVTLGSILTLHCHYAITISQPSTLCSTDSVLKAQQTKVQSGGRFGADDSFFRPDAAADAGVGWERIRVPATECPRLLPETLERERQAMGDRWFRQEYLCEFADTEETVFPEDLIRKAINFDIKPLW